MSVYALLAPDTVGAVDALADERGWTDTMTMRVAGSGQGPDLLEEAARVPSDLLLLDVSIGPGLGQAVLRYRLARPETRVVLLAPGAAPGDAEVAAVVAAGVYDVVEDLADLGSVIDRPRGLPAAARWLGGAAGATAQPDTASARQARTRWGFWRRERPPQPAVAPPSGHAEGDRALREAGQAVYADTTHQEAQDAADDPWPVFRPSELPPAPTQARREVTMDWVRVARGGMAVIGVTVSLVRLALWLGALVFLGLLGLRLLAMWNEMSIIWRGMLQ